MSKTENQVRFQQLLIRLVLVGLPTVLIAYITLRFLNFSYTALNTSILGQTVYFSCGLILAYSLYYYNARVVTTFVLLCVIYWLSGIIISRLPGEFDVFKATALFELYSTIFIFGWVFGFLLAKVKWSYAILFSVLAIATIVSISDTIDLTISYVLLHLAPVVVYGLYMLFLTPLLTEHIELNRKQSGKLAIRVVLLVLLVLFAFFITSNLLKGDLQAVEKELAARGAKDKDKDKNNGGDYDDRYGLMEKDDDAYRLKDTMRVNTKMSSSDKLMFCSKLDNFFPDGSPAPLYFVYHYLTRYDVQKESFTRDIDVPSFDEIDVDPTKLPMYNSYIDTSIVRKSLASKMRKVVEAQVYLSENTWKHSVLGPSSVFALQTIPVEKDFQKTFLSAYKIYSYTSELNNAYFVYNISANQDLEEIQMQRNSELGRIKNYNKVDKEVLDYYTEYPTGGIYDSISKLAASLAPKDARPLDKVLAVRDFFLKRNENGKRIFRYTLKAGAVDDPNIPSSRMLYDFLFKTHAGYCTYYAGASLFMLRSLGVPARFTTGFATINRSDKNKGWYWFYASQAHAWTQVYFPEYGWMDFDMTIGNEGQRDAPKPDGTPPLPPPEPWLVLNAQVITVDQKAKSIDATFKQMLFQNIPFNLEKPVSKQVDASLARILYDEKDTTFAVLQPGDSVIIVSYKDEAKKDPVPRAGVAIEKQLESFPAPIVADEIHIRVREKDKKKEQEDAAKKKEEVEEKKMTWQEIALMAAIGVGSLIVFILLLPLLYLLYRFVRASTSRGTHRIDHIYRLALYRFHMAGFEREAETPLGYAQHQVDPALHVQFEAFMRIYLRLKYTSGTMRDGEEDAINQFTKGVGPAIRARNGFFKMAGNYLNVLLALRYFQQPEKTDYETPTL